MVMIDDKQKIVKLIWYTIRVFSYMIAYIIVNMIMESMGIMISFPEIIRGIRHEFIRYFNNIYNSDMPKI